MTIVANRCIYCGATGTTKEHFWGKWSRQHATNLAKATHTITRPQNPERPTAPYTQMKGALTRPGNTRSQTLKIACGTCNNGWMGNLVERAIPILLPLTKGQWKDLNADERLTLANWLTMYTMSIEGADRETAVISQDDRTAFMNSVINGGGPSNKWQIAIGAMSPFHAGDTFHHRAMALYDDGWTKLTGYSQHTRISFGELLAFTYYSDEPIDYLVATYAWDNGLHPLFPLTLAPIGKPLMLYSPEDGRRLFEGFPPNTKYWKPPAG